MTPLELAKNNLSIPELWKLRTWNGKPGRSCRVPWREDHAPSGSVLADGRLFHDFTSGETLDAPGLLARVEDLTPETGCKLFIQLSGIDPHERIFPRPSPAVKSRPAASPPTKPELPLLKKPTSDELHRLAILRAVSVEACEAAVKREHLFCADWHGERCWIVTAEQRHNAQFRRLDGLPFSTRSSGKVKALTARGSCASWPVGAVSAGKDRRIMLCEGGGDFLAAYHFACIEGTLADVQPVALLGAAQRIHEEALPFFAEKRVRIFPHLDSAGASAALRWEVQLCAASAKAHCFDLSELTRDDLAPVQDLNDLTRISPDDFEATRELWAITTF